MAVLQKENVLGILKDAVKDKSALVELYFQERASSTTRFANNTIHQNISVKDFQIHCRYIEDGRAGVASTNCFTRDSLTELVSQARSLAKFSQKDPYLSGLPEKADYIKLENFDDEARDATPEYRAGIVKGVIEKIKKHNLNCAGQVTTTTLKDAVVNTNGVSCFHPSSRVNFTLTVMDEASSGYSEENSFSIVDFKIERAVDKAIADCLNARGAQEIEPGIYEVVLEPLAVAEMIGNLSMLGFSGLDYEEGTSFFSGKLEQRVFGENITIVDSPFDRNMCGLPFDFEGFPKKDLTFIENGKVVNIAYDSYTAKKYKKENNGFAIPLEHRQWCGPLPFNLKLMPGSATKEELISSVKKGLLITRFWYVRTVDKKKTIVTGMTRDGVYLIEGGKIKHPVKNLRFTQNIADALAKVDAVSKDPGYTGEYFLTAAPAVKIKEFNFSSKAKH